MSSLPHLRTPDDRFTSLTGYPWGGHFIDGLPSLHGLRLHRIDEGPRDAPITWLCLHGNPAWSYLNRRMIPTFLFAGQRVVAPDLPGFGKSDKPRDESAHTFTWHRTVLLELIDLLDLRNVNLVVMNTMLATAEQPLPQGFLDWRTMCRAKPDFSVARLFARASPDLSKDECAAYDAPFPTPEHRAATRAFPELVPESPSADGVAVSRQAATFWLDEWQGRTIMATGERDPIFTPVHMEALRLRIRGCPPPLRIGSAGHFVQEHGSEIAIEAVRSLG